MRLVVRHKPDEEGGPRGHDRGRGNLPAELAPWPPMLAVPVNNLHVVIPGIETQEAVLVW